MMRFLRRLVEGDSLGYVESWNTQVMERLERSTARYLGEPYEGCGPVRVVGNRIVEAREARVAAMRRAQIFSLLKGRAAR